MVTGIDRGPVGFTCQAFAALSLDPPMVVIAPSKASKSWPRIARMRAFCANILASNQAGLARAFSVSGADKFAGVGWDESPVSGAPILRGAVAWAECRLEEIYEGGDHQLATARVVMLGQGDGPPLLFYRGGFGTFAM